MIITTKDLPVLRALLDYYGMPYINLGRKGRSFPEKVLRQLVFTLKIWKIAIKNKVDLGIGISLSIPQAAKFCKMKSILLDDDDKAITPLFYHFAHRFSDYILSPDCLAFQQGGKRYIYYSGYHELAYLHPDVFIPDREVLLKLSINSEEPYFILRFTSFGAYHDKNQTGLSLDQKLRLIEKLKKYGKVFITGEKQPEPEIKPYLVHIHPAEMHSFMAFATLFLGDSQTMTSEAAVLGVPSVKCNTFAGILAIPNELENKYGLCYSFLPRDFSKMLLKIDELLTMPNLKTEWQNKRNKMLAEKINVADYFTSFYENFEKP